MVRKPFVDGLRVVASLAVVTIHVTARHADWPAASGGGCVANVAYVMGSLCNFAVPLFLMVTGSLLLGRAEPWAGFLGKRCSRLFPPFIFWNLAYLTFALFFASNLKCSERLAQFAMTLAAASHLWYLPMLLWITLFVPFVNDALVGRKMTSGDWRVCIGIGCAFVLLNQLACMLTQFGYGRPNWFAGTPYLICLLLGYCLDAHAQQLRRWLPVLAVAVAGALFLGFVLGFCTRGSGLDVLLFDNLGCLSLLSASTLFLVFRLRESRWLNSGWVRSLGDCSFGIYLIHPFFLRVVERTAGKEIDELLRTAPSAGAVGLLLALILGVFASSYAAIVLLRRTNVGLRIS